MEGNTGTGIESAVLPTAVVLHGSMAVQQFACLVLIAVVYDGTVVTAEYKNGVVGNAEAVQSVHDFTHGPVQLEDDVAAYAQTSCRRNADVARGEHVHLAYPYKGRKVRLYGL